MRLCDVTLREGDQMPGRSYSIEQKVNAGIELDQLGVEYLQAGFPITGEKDQEVIEKLSAETDAQVVSLARALKDDVDTAVAADTDVVEIIAGISDRQLKYVVGKSRGQMFDAIQRNVDRVREQGVPVHLTVVDAFRTNQEHLFTMFDRITGTELVNLADTVGVRTPTEVQSWLETLERNVDLDRIGVHFHDDLGVATANALVADEMGVAKLDVSVAALGERAGNPALEEIIVTKTLREELSENIQSREVIPICRRVLGILDEEIPPRKAVLGTESMTHESGLHTAVMMDDPSVFEPFDPKRFGGERRLLFGEGTGRSTAVKLFNRAGVDPSEDKLNVLLKLLTEHGPLSLEQAVTLINEQFS